MEGGLFDGERFGRPYRESQGVTDPPDGWALARRPGDEPGGQSSDGSDKCFFLVTSNSRPTARTVTTVEEYLAECRAFRDPLMVSERQRDLVCLTAVHATCPRFLRASVVEEEPEPDEEEAGEPEAPRVHTGVASSGLLSKAFDGALALALTVIIVIAIAAATSPLWGSSLAGSKSSPTPAVTPAATESVAPSPSAVPTATLAPTPSPTATPKPVATPVPVTSPSWPPGATASRMSLLKPCSNQANCYLYTIRSGDKLRGIAEFFGVSYDAILAMNPEISNPDYIQAGQSIRIPPPTK